MAPDPLCGNYVDSKSAVSRIIQGRIFYFCGEECAEKFQVQTLATAKHGVGPGSSRTGSGDEISPAGGKV